MYNGGNVCLVYWHPLLIHTQVSWIRKRDLHILTIGIITYTNDQRYQALHTDGSDEWILRIRSAQMRDSGTYECQVSTETKISQAFRFTVVGEYSNWFSACNYIYFVSVSVRMNEYIDVEHQGVPQSSHVLKLT